MNTIRVGDAEWKQSMSSARKSYAEMQEKLELAETHMKQGDECGSTNNYYFAIESYQHALTIYSQIMPSSMNVGRSQSKLGDCWSKRGNLEKAIQCYSEALKIYSNIPGISAHESHRSCHEALGNLYFLTGDNERALVHKEENLKISLVLYNRKHQVTANAYCNLGEFFISTADQYSPVSPTHYPNISRKIPSPCLVDEKKESFNQSDSSSSEEKTAHKIARKTKNNSSHSRTPTNPAKRILWPVEKAQVNKHQPSGPANVIPYNFKIAFAYMRLRLATFYLSEAILIDVALNKRLTLLRPTFKQFERAMAREELLEGILKSQNTAKSTTDQVTSNENAIPTDTRENTHTVSLADTSVFDPMYANTYSKELFSYKAQNKIISDLSRNVPVKILSGIRSMR